MTAAGDSTPSVGIPGAAGPSLGSLVEFTGTAAQQASSAGLCARGEVTGFLAITDAQTEIAVRCPGDTRSHLFFPYELQPAPSFRELPTYQGLVSTPLDAETLLIRATARAVAADHRDLLPRYEDIRDHHDLLRALSDWCGLQPEELAELVLPKVANRLHELEHDLDPWRDLRPAYAAVPATQIAMADFPISLALGVSLPPPPSRPVHTTGQPPPSRRPAAS